MRRIITATAVMVMIASSVPANASTSLSNSYLAAQVFVNSTVINLQKAYIEIYDQNEVIKPQELKQAFKKTLAGHTRNGSQKDMVFCTWVSANGSDKYNKWCVFDKPDNLYGIFTNMYLFLTKNKYTPIWKISPSEISMLKGRNLFDFDRNFFTKFNSYYDKSLGNPEIPANKVAITNMQRTFMESVISKLAKNGDFNLSVTSYTSGEKLNASVMNFFLAAEIEKNSAFVEAVKDYVARDSNAETDFGRLREAMLEAGYNKDNPAYKDNIAESDVGKLVLTAFILSSFQTEKYYKELIERYKTNPKKAQYCRLLSEVSKKHGKIILTLYKNK